MDRSQYVKCDFNHRYMDIKIIREVLNKIFNGDFETHVVSPKMFPLYHFLN